MTGFQHLAVDTGAGPHVTLVAGTRLAGCSWSTTSGDAAKVRAIRAIGRAAVLTGGLPVTSGNGCPSADVAAEGWTLLAGKATVVDPRRPLDAWSDPVAASLAGLALARIALEHTDQLAGYLRDACDVPTSWRPASRVMIVVHGDHLLTSRAGAIIEATGAFRASSALPEPVRRPRRKPSPIVTERLSARQALLVTRPGRCAVGLLTPIGPVAVPGWWDPGQHLVQVDRAGLERLHAELPGPCCVTFDDSADDRPSGKLGVMLRSRVVGLLGPQSTASAVALGVDVGRVVSWSGFATSGDQQHSGARAAAKGG